MAAKHKDSLHPTIRLRVCWINRIEDENRLDGSRSSRWEAATVTAALMAGRRGRGDDIVTAAFSVLLREPGAGRRVNGRISRGEAPTFPSGNITRLAHAEGKGEGPESDLGLLAFTAFPENTFVPPRYVAQMEKATKRGAALI